MTREPRHFSMIRAFHVADLFTIANGFCGVAAVFAAMRFVASGGRGQLYLACLLVPCAIVFDFLDGRVARFRHESSPLGKEMDSLADLISFGVAPAAIAYAAGLQGGIDQLVLMFFAGCGLSRLARYNVTAAELAGPSGKVKYFEGTPITFSILPLGILLLDFRDGSLAVATLRGASVHFVALAFFVSGCLMISKTIRIPKP